MKKFTHFLIYNNTVPLVFGILFLGAGATFAASPEAREAVVDSESAIVSVDNSYLLQTDIADSVVYIAVNSVTENAKAYFVEYTMNTLGVRDGVWQPIVKLGTMEVEKEEIVGQDLGLYVEEELAEVHAAELRLLRETKVNEERAGLTPKVVATEYSGLVGQFFDPSQEVFPGYDPLISPDVGIPLTREQKAAHEEVRRLVEEQKEKEERANQEQLSPNETNQENDTDTNSGEPPVDGGNEGGGEQNPPVEETPPEGTPEPPPVTEEVIFPPSDPVQPSEILSI